MKKIILNQYLNSIFNLNLVDDEELIGRLTVYDYKNNQGMLDFYIEEEWRCRWLSKNYAKFIYQIGMCT